MFEEYNLKVRWKINSKIIYLIRTNYYTVISDVLHARIGIEKSNLIASCSNVTLYS